MNKILIIGLMLAVAVAASSEFHSKESVVPEESEVATSDAELIADATKFFGKALVKIKKNAAAKIKKHAKKGKSLVKQHISNAKKFFSKVKKLAKKGKKGSIKKLVKAHIKKLKKLVKKYAQKHMRK